MPRLRCAADPAAGQPYRRRSGDPGSVEGGRRDMNDLAPVTVRLATVDDVALLHRFSIGLATYEDEPDAVTSTPQTLARDGFGKEPKFVALIAERGAVPVGFALYTFNYSVWTAARGIFIEDIWVVRPERRGGVARALMQRWRRRARRGGKSPAISTGSTGTRRAGSTSDVVSAGSVTGCPT